MTLSRKIAAAVEAGFAGDGNAAPLSVEEGEARLTLNVFRAGPIGVECDRLEFQAPKPEVPLAATDLKNWADRIVARVTYLMEPLVVLEIDRNEVQAELRSEKPTPRDGSRSYYELVLGKDASARLERVAFKDSDRKRVVVPFQLTREVLERLADDLVASSP